VIAWIVRVWRRLLGWLLGRDTSAPFQLVYVVEHPDVVAPRRVYAVGENGYLWHALLICPCGCEQKIALNLVTDDAPCWTLTDDGGVPTLHPSVWRHVGCRSHFFLRAGRIVWCESRTDSGQD
jgi:hypothetical protein